MTNHQEPPIAEVYIDESSHTNHRYLVLGGIIAGIKDARIASDAIADARLPLNALTVSHRHLGGCEGFLSVRSAAECVLNLVVSHILSCGGSAEARGSPRFCGPW